MLDFYGNKVQMKVIGTIVLMVFVMTFCFYSTSTQAATVASDFLGLKGVTGQIVDSTFDSGCKLIGGTTFNLAQSLYESGTAIVSVLTSDGSTSDKAFGWAEVGLNMANAACIIVAIATGSATLPVIAAITLGIAGAKIIVSVLKNGDKILSWLEKFIGNPLKGLLEVYKPNIYIYSEQDREVNVRLQPEDYITQSIPLYPSRSGWLAKVFNGSIDGCNHFLFYEARIPDKNLQRDSGFSVKQATLQEDLLYLMKLYGFNEKETADFIEYWQEKLAGEADYLFYPQETKRLDDIMPLTVEPQPETIFRLWFLIEVDDGQAYEKITTVNTINRTNYHVVEWGGIY